jgi:hypothetical protein
MSRPILSDYGPNSSQPQRASASCGGVCEGDTKDVMNYCPPVGPTNIMDPKSPGLHGVNHGLAPADSGGRHSGSPGLGGTNHGCGTQGKY